MKYAGFSGSRAEHARMVQGLLVDTEGHLDSAERVLRGGDCHAGIDSAMAAERYFGEARGHYSHATATLLTRKRMQGAMRRLNFLRQALKRCAG